MPGVSSSQLCRVTVIGPGRKADLAVPVTTSIGSLLPVFLRHTAGRPNVDGIDVDSSTVDAAAEDGATSENAGPWVLQRLGESPMDVEGTPESLDWLEGEELHLRRAEMPLPELAFDDLAEGIAESVQRQPDRWRPEYRRPLFLVLAGIVTVVIGVVLAADGLTAVRAGGAGIVSAGFLSYAVYASRRLADGVLAVLAALACCGLAGLAGLCWLDGVAGRTLLNADGVLGAAVMVLVASAVVLAAHSLLAERLPAAPFLGIAFVSLATILGCWLWRVLGFQLGAAAGITACVLFAVVIFAPKIVIKAAHLRGPQLPKTADELRFDIEPEQAPEVRAKTRQADHYLSALTAGSGVAIVAAFAVLVGRSGWASWCLVVLLAAGMLLRSRAFLGLWQRGALVFGGGGGTIMLLALLWRAVSPGWQAVVLLGLLVLLATLVTAALRPPPRRLLPIWEHIARTLDMLTAIAVVPVLLQLLGVYGAVRGLFG